MNCFRYVNDTLFSRLLVNVTAMSLQKELSLLNPDRELESSDDFDRLVMGSPDSSLIWIRYMAFFLQRGDVSKARAVAERALKTISVK